MFIHVRSNVVDLGDVVTHVESQLSSGSDLRDFEKGYLRRLRLKATQMPPGSMTIGIPMLKSHSADRWERYISPASSLGRGMAAGTRSGSR